jgi:hypothetical protein
MTKKSFLALAPGVWPVALSLAVGEGDRLDEVVVRLLDDDAELGLPTQRRVDDEGPGGAEGAVRPV